MPTESDARYLAEVRELFRKQKTLAEEAIAQVDDAALLHALDEEANSIAVLLRHLGGNLRSRWTDFLTSDGEKPDRDRDAEFVVPPGTTRETVLGWWEEGWRRVFETLAALGPEDLDRRVTIRGEPLAAREAISRSLVHVSYHVGQIVLLAKYLRAGPWRSLSIPRRR